MSTKSTPILWSKQNNIRKVTINSSEAGVLHGNNLRKRRKIINQQPQPTRTTINAYSRRQEFIYENLQHQNINKTIKQRENIDKLNNKAISNKIDILYECRICCRKFTHNCSLQFHKRIHTGEKLYRCNVCGKICTKEKNLIKHKKVHS